MRKRFMSFLVTGDVKKQGVSINTLIRFMRRVSSTLECLGSITLRNMTEFIPLLEGESDCLPLRPMHRNHTPALSEAGKGKGKGKGKVLSVLN
jgi:hypothetical protein